MTPKQHNEWARKQKNISFFGYLPLIIPEKLFYKMIELGEYDKYKNTFLVSKKNHLIINLP